MILTAGAWVASPFCRDALSSVVMAMDVPSRPFVAAHLLHAVGTVGQVGDDLDEELQEEFGGRTFYGVRAPRTDEDATGGYL